jgi:DNA repair exonuclease SbcCD nuclease subunit
MAFRFIHTGDWHIGKPFGGFDDEVAVVLRRARLDAVDRIAAVALAESCSHVLVAGDIYDSEGLGDRDLRQLTERLRRHGDLVWHLLPGNHDPLREGGLWSRLARLGMSDNVRLHAAAEPSSLAESVRLLPAPCVARRSADDPTVWMDACVRRPGEIRIGLAHGPAHGFGGEGMPAGVIAPTRRRSAGLDYLALGDWHGCKELAEGVWYAGTPEPDQFPDNEPGYVLRVTIAEPGAVPDVVRLPVGQFRWYRRQFTCLRDDDVASMVSDLRAVDPDPGQCLVRVEVVGSVSIAVEARLRAELEALSPAFLHIRERLDGLQVRLEPDQIHERFGSPYLAAVAKRLTSLADGASDEAAAAKDALRLLARYDLTVGGGPGAT